MHFETKTPWYIEGLRFQCQKCGNCCCGPEEGYVWLTKKEVELIADILKISVEKVLRKYCRRIGFRMSLLERQDNKNCVFVSSQNDCKQCAIYNVRPSQCRIWPFWLSNLSTADAWDKVSKECSGINNGYLYSFEEIRKISGANE